jgi:NAD(P)-dependent dehydrogenase (short-subunit alcohol dehydrogenase family)
MTKFVIILGISADIGRSICKYYLKDGFQVLGTYRNFSKDMSELLNLERLVLFKCDVTQREDIFRLAEFIRNKNIWWSTLFSSIGTSEPIGAFFEIPFDNWENSIQINCLGQLRVLHALYQFRSQDVIPNVVFLAGGGTNNAFKNYSAYCLSKIMLIKMCELLDAENNDLNVFIVGPGLVKTKTHLETLKAGKSAGDNYERIKKFWESEKAGTSMEKIYACIRWLESKGKAVSGGRNISVVHDMWGSDELACELSRDDNMYKLRRFRNDSVRKRRTP